MWLTKIFVKNMTKIVHISEEQSTPQELTFGVDLRLNPKF